LANGWSWKAAIQYRARAYSRAAENLSLISVPLGQLVAEGRLKEIPGIGDTLADVISQLYRTGHHPRLGKIRETKQCRLSFTGGGPGEANKWLKMANTNSQKSRPKPPNLLDDLWFLDWQPASWRHGLFLDPFSAFRYLATGNEHGE
jgi:hypothetical protein